MIWSKIKTVALIILGITVLMLSVGLWDPFDLRKRKDDGTGEYTDPALPAKQEKERQAEKDKADADAYKDLADLGTRSSGDTRDRALLDLLSKDYPGSDGTGK